MYEYLQVGKIANAHGLKGELKVIPLTDHIERFLELEFVYIKIDSRYIKYPVDNVRFNKNSVILKLKGIDSRGEAENYKGMFLEIDRTNAVKLPKDSYFICDITGCIVIDENGSLLGKVVEVLQLGSNDVYVVKNHEGREVLIPALKSVVKDLSVENKTINVILPEGLIENEI